ncbi:unnamed protein product [Calicophoron daubneyi]|uniref:EF-hand domain-containing protein n=1 Tax=Calicophoron daubneyi TaxID=300641 RepID=A0AAV2TD85_CALDB
MSELSEKDLEEARDTFALFDSVGDEKIEVKDIGEVVRALGLNPTESDIRKFSSQTDSGECFVSFRLLNCAGNFTDRYR